MPLYCDEGFSIGGLLYIYISKIIWFADDDTYRKTVRRIKTLIVNNYPSVLDMLLTIELEVSTWKKAHFAYISAWENENEESFSSIFSLGWVR